MDGICPPTQSCLEAIRDKLYYKNLAWVAVQDLIALSIAAAPLA